MYHFIIPAFECDIITKNMEEEMEMDNICDIDEIDEIIILKEKLELKK